MLPQFDVNEETSSHIVVALYGITLVVTTSLWFTFTTGFVGSRKERKVRTGLLIIGWLLLVWMVSQMADLKDEQPEHKMDPYEVFEISRGASIDQVQSRYKRLRLLRHPDKKEEEKRVKNITAAYEILMEKLSRSWTEILSINSLWLAKTLSRWTAVGTGSLWTVAFTTTSAMLWMDCLLVFSDF